MNDFDDPRFIARCLKQLDKMLKSQLRACLKPPIGSDGRRLTMYEQLELMRG